MNVKQYIHNFGLKIFISKVIRKPFYKGSTSISKFICNLNENLIKKFLIQNIDSNNNTVKLYNNNLEKNSIIWTMWWQGLDEAPLLVKKCIESQQKNNPAHKVIIITSNNYDKYVKLPDFVIEKFKKGQISITHLSDIIRVNLLYQYGGIWADSTILMTKGIPEKWFDKEFYTINTGLYTNDPSHGRWTTFFIESKRGSKLMKFLAESFNDYLFKYDRFIDYILFDYLIEIGYENDKHIRENIDSILKNNPDVFLLQKYLLKPVNSFNYINNSTFLYKLSYKNKKIIVNGHSQLSIYDKIIQE